MLQLIAPIKHLSEAAAPITRGLAALERGVDLLDADAGPRPAAASTRAAPSGRIELRDVSLALPRRRRDAGAAIASA